MLLPLLFSLLSLDVFTTSEVSPIFSPVLPNFRFVGETRVAGVVELGGELRFFNKREVRLPKKRKVPGVLGTTQGLVEKGEKREGKRRAKREAGTSQGLVEKGEKREGKRRGRREARLIKDPRFNL